jgi:hypothetical protein
MAQGHLLLDPTEGIQEISRRQALPKPVLSTTEVTRLLAAPDVSRPLGVRDRTLLEVLYATGVPSQLRNAYAASGCADSASAGDVGACLDRDHASLHAGDHH